MKTSPAIGTRIYYTGDMANQSDWGTVVADASRTGYIALKFDSGKQTAYLSPAQIGDVYEGHCGTRFVTETAYNTFKAKRIAEYEAWANRMTA